MHSDPAAPPIARPLAALEEDIRCPLCNYNLRGLTQPRCPECGFTFEWQELLDPTRRKHPYLFEHHPERNVWSFFKTLLGAQRPRRFWTTLTPAQPSMPRRLGLYAFAMNGIFLVLLAVGFFMSVVGNSVVRAQSNVRDQAATIRMFNSQNSNPRTAQFWKQVLAQYGSIQAYNDRYFPTSALTLLRDASMWTRALQSGGQAAGACVAILAWPWTTVAALMLFRISMRRASIKSSHVLRCIVYNTDLALWAALVALPVNAFSRLGIPYLTGSRPTSALFIIHALPFAVLGAMLIVWTWRLAIAYRSYLRFSHPVTTVIASQALVVMFWLNLSLIDVWF